MLTLSLSYFVFFNDTATTEIYTLSLHDALPISTETGGRLDQVLTQLGLMSDRGLAEALARLISAPLVGAADYPETPLFQDRKSTRLNSSHLVISYAGFCLKKKKQSRFDSQASRD